MFGEDLQTARHILVLCRHCDSHHDILPTVILAPRTDRTDRKDQNSEKGSEGPISHSRSALELGFKVNTSERHGGR